MVIPRKVESYLRDRLSVMPAVALIGPRQVGKTTLALDVAETWEQPTLYLDLEQASDRRRLEDAETYLRAKAGQLVILDEVHRLPGLFEVLRGVIDERRRRSDRAGHFLLLGSASLELTRSSETLAGRIAYVDLGVLTADEVAEARISTDQLWLRGGFPDSLASSNDRDSYLWRMDLIRSYLERDVPMFAPRASAETIRRLWAMLAHFSGGLLNSARIATSLGISAPTVNRYLDLLVDLGLVRRLRPWATNTGKRLVKNSKVYIRDSGLIHALLELPTLDSVLSHLVAGMSWESFVLETLISAAGPNATPYFYRTSNGSEVDLILVRGGRPDIAIEVKRSPAAAVSKGFHQACDDLNIGNRFLITSQEELVPRAGVIAVGPVGMARQLRSQGYA